MHTFCKILTKCIFFWTFVLSLVCRWRQQHEYLEKLNMQALLNASQNEDEFVKEYLIDHDKVSHSHISVSC